MQPSIVSRRFLFDLLEWLVSAHPEQWEQAAWNEVRFKLELVAGQNLRYCT